LFFVTEEVFVFAGWLKLNRMYVCRRRGAGESGMNPNCDEPFWYKCYDNFYYPTPVCLFLSNGGSDRIAKNNGGDAFCGME
jgi:hypothetical protein